jgi:hypothetical protein
MMLWEERDCGLCSRLMVKLVSGLSRAAGGVSVGVATVATKGAVGQTRASWVLTEEVVEDD